MLNLTLPDLPHAVGGVLPIAPVEPQAEPLQSNAEADQGNGALDTNPYA